MKKIIKSFFLLNLCLFSIHKYSYGQKKDAGLWASVKFEKPITSSLLCHFQQSERIGQNISQLNYSHSDFGITYEFKKYLETSLNYRFISKLKYVKEISFRHRLYWTLTLKKKFKPIVFVYRQKLQYELDDIYSSETGQIPFYYTRSKINIKCSIKPFAPYIAAELFTQIINWDKLVSDKYRVFIGTCYKLNKINELDLYYLIDRAINITNPTTKYIIGIGFTHTFY